MGAKHHLAPVLADIVKNLPAGPCLDLFAGLCSVSVALAPQQRPAWSNDIQAYAQTVARALLRGGTPPSLESAAERLYPWYSSNMVKLGKRFVDEQTAERQALHDSTYEALFALDDAWRHTGNDQTVQREVRRLRKAPKTKPYRLATLSFAHGYFGLRQAMELDSIRYSIDAAVANHVFTRPDADWLLVALMVASSHVSAAPGHFAQFLHVRDQPSFERIAKLRRRSVWEQFLTDLSALSPYGDRAWRKSNRTFGDDAIRLTSRLAHSSSKPTIVYADPPYSEAQYSRYYHVLETLVKYDYPDAMGAGRCRPDRFSTPFSLSRRVVEAFDQLAKGVSRLNAALILTYPSNGLLYGKGSTPQVVLARWFQDVDFIGEVDATHSTLGASPGRASTPVVERVFVASNPRRIC